MTFRLSLEQQRTLLEQVSRLMDADDEERQQAVTQALATDPDYGAALERMLSRIDEEDPALDRGVSFPEMRGTGERCGAWVLQEQIGSGGMGDVWRATRADGAFDRDVAIKRVWMRSPGMAARFLRERQLLAKLQHPNIAQIMDGGIEDGQPWFAMELVEGEHITEWCRQQRASLRQRVELVAQVCDAVAFAHRNLIVHRDIKPGNVLVDTRAQAKLLDFGIAKLLEDADPAQTQTLAMTPAWSAPEQRRGEPVTTAVDIWQLGLLLRQLLCGPAQSPASERSCSEELQRLQIQAPNVATQHAAACGGSTPADLARAVRGDLDSIVARATRDDPTARYPSADEMAVDLRAWLQGQPVAARANERGYQARRWVKQWWPAVAALFAAVAFTGYHIHTLRSGLQREQALRQQAQVAQRLASQQRDRAINVADYFGNLFRNDAARDIAGGETPARVLLERSVDRLQSDTHLPPTTRAELLGAAADAFSQLNLREQELAAQHAAITALESVPDVDPTPLASAYARAGKSYNVTGDFDQADQWLKKAQNLVRGGHVVDRDVLVRVIQLEGNQANGRMQYARAAESYRRIVSLIGQGPLDPRQRGELIGAQVNLARLPTTGAVEAERNLRSAEKLIQMEQPVDMTLLYATRGSLALAIGRQGRLEEAIALADGVLKDSEAYFTDDDPWLAINRDVAARISLGKGDVTRARELSNRAATDIAKRFPVGAPQRRRMALVAAIASMTAKDQGGADRWLRQVEGPPIVKPSDQRLWVAARACAVFVHASTPQSNQALQAALADVQADVDLRHFYPMTLWAKACNASGGTGT